MLELKDIKKYYDSTLVLDIPSLKLDNNIYWLSGANGSGKTTLLKMITGLLPFDGDITVNSTSIRKQPVIYRRKFGWAETEPLFPLFLTGADLIHLYCNIRKAQQKEPDTLLSIYNMAGYINKPIGAYSAGMIKKLSIVLAFIGSPEWIILDEPFITLDANAEALTQSLILDKHKDANTNFIITSHQEFDDELMQACTNILIEKNNVIIK
ncbi:ABC transporter ATP-binding protein [Parafilimonas sp.]|uniref:ABC transporter ATP-binding protein n=1 Tax=Parafilimonas sp. TaxID=1969739 RepID=UPI0039E6BE9E